MPLPTRNLVIEKAKYRGFTGIDKNNAQDYHVEATLEPGLENRKSYIRIESSDELAHIIQVF
jgi:hypothetical protein